ncbi:hypothetical protein Taro_046982 [Colocasia esculenta]|uniref:Nuclear pore complex protein NUP1 n=1 Tax=Colocasia esculenta TaxID=4460 RepID=A0A843X670_COLES|nr:hypothetical protein [Colocasia esculenta]
MKMRRSGRAHGLSFVLTDSANEETIPLQLSKARSGVERRGIVGFSVVLSVGNVPGILGSFVRFWNGLTAVGAAPTAGSSAVRKRRSKGAFPASACGGLCISLAIVFSSLELEGAIQASTPIGTSLLGTVPPPSSRPCALSLSRRRAAPYSLSLSPRNAVASCSLPEGHSLKAPGEGTCHKGSENSTNMTTLLVVGVDDEEEGANLAVGGAETSTTKEGGTFVLKRRSSVIESDIGSFGAIRRIRQKSNLASPSKDMTMLFSGKLLPPTPNALNNSQTSTFSAQMPLTPKEPKYDTPQWSAADNGDEKGGDFSVPRQSTEMARKILQQLGKIVPSPKEKSSEAKTISMHESPPKLTLNMLHGQALKSVAEIDSSKIFNADTNGMVDGADYSRLRSSVSPKHDKVQGNGSSKVSPSELKLEFEARGVDSNLISVADARPIKGHSDSIFPQSSAGLLQKKPAFTMQAPEGFLELEDEINNSRDDAFGSLATGKGKTEASKKEPKILISEDQVKKKRFAFSSESKVASGLTLSKESGKGVTDRLAVADKETGFTFQVAPSQSQPPLTPTMPSPAVEKSSPVSEQITAPTFTFSSQTTPLTFPSSMASFTEPTSLKFGVKADLKGPLFGSSTTGTVTTPVGSESSKSDTKKAGDLFKTSGAPSSSTLMTSTTSNTSLFTASATSSQSNGSLASTTTIFSVSAAAPATSLLGSSAGGIFSATSASSSASSSASIAPSTSPAMTFQFGTGSAVSTKSVSSVVKSSSTSSGMEPVKESSFGIISSVAATPSSMGTGMFGFGAAASSSASGTAGSIFGTQVTKVGSGTSPFAQSMTSQFSPSSAPAFGLGGASFGFGSSAFGSSMSTTKPSLVSSSAFGQSSTTSSGAVADSSAPSSSSLAPSATSPSLFGSSSQSTTSSVFGSVFGSSSSTSTMFTSAASSTASATMLFGSSSSSPLTFSSSTPATSSTASAATLFGASSSPLTFSSSAPATSSTASTTALFGASSSSPVTFSSSAPATSSAFLFTQTTTASSPALSFTPFGTTTSSVSLSPAVPAFGMPTPTVGFGSASPGNDQMNVEDSMADDTVQATMASVPSFGQPPNVPGSNMPFGSPATPSGTPAFQFASHQPSAFPQPPFQATGSFEFGGGFSMGSGGGDKSGRRIIKAKRDKHRKK